MQTKDEIYYFKEVINRLDNIQNLKSDLKYALQNCNLLIDSGELFLAYLLLEKIKKKDSLQIFKLEENILKNKIEEICHYTNLDIYTKYLIDSYLLFGKFYYKNKDFKKAYSYYIQGLNRTGYNLFNYYIGKIHYKMHNNKGAIKYFKEYNKTGFDKWQKSRLYLGKILKFTNELSLCQKYYDEINHINEIFYFSKTNFNIDEKDDNVDYYDLKPKEILRKIKMKVEDFRPS